MGVMLAEVLVAGGIGVLASRAWRRVRWRRRLARLSARVDDSRPRGVADLSPALAALVDQARIVRIIAATPLHRVDTQLWPSPTRRREHLAAYDRAVVELRRAIWDWRSGFARLAPAERSLLRASGVREIPLAGVLLRGLDRPTDTWDEGLWSASPSLAQVERVLATVDAELRRFEAAVAVAARSPYRAAA